MNPFKKTLILSLLFAFTLAKGQLLLKKKFEFEEGAINDLYIKVTTFLKESSFKDLEAINIVPKIEEFGGVDIIINYTLTYIPIFFLILFIPTFIYYRIKKSISNSNPKKNIPENIRAYLDIELERMYNKKLREEVRKEVHLELSRLRHQSNINRRNKVA